MLVRPQFWGFFILDLERAFAFYWNMKAFLLLGGVFLLLMLLTGNDFGVSVLGSTWVFFSGFMQWWYSTPGMLPEMVGCVAVLLVAAHYMALASRRWVIGVSTLLFSICLLDSVLSLYPAFQVPLLYLGMALLVGSLAPRLASDPPRRELPFRIGCAGLALSAVAGLLFLYYCDAKQAIDLMRGTVYPGSRSSSGGGVALAQVFGGFYGFFMAQEKYPRTWGNVCEASNFVLLFPVPVAALLWQAWRRQRVTGPEWGLIIYLAVVLSWVILGWPHALAAASGFGLSPGTRSLLGLGLASVLLCCIFLARTRAELPRGLGPRLLIAASLLALLVAFAAEFNRVTAGFVTGDQVLVVSLVACAAGYLLLTRKRLAFAACILMPSIWSYALVNPLAVGLGPILHTKLFQQVSRIVDRDPEARWAVYGNFVTANLFKAAGAQAFNGTKIVPPLEDLRVLDPTSTAASTYNRYAHMELVPEQGSNVAFSLLQADLYAIKIDPMSDLWRQLGVRYVVLPFAATDPEFLAKATVALAFPDIGLWVYKYQWSTERSSLR